jgi:hypothetical protein
VDFLNFPDLTTDVLGQAFGFLLGRLSTVLDRRGRDDENVELEEADVLEGTWRPTPPDEDKLAAELPELYRFAGVLRPYEQHPERIVVDDNELLNELGRLRLVLETVYGQRITFRGEDRAPTGTRVIQEVDTVRSGTVLGVEADQVGRADVTQRVREVDAGGSIIGVRARRIDS